MMTNANFDTKITTVFIIFIAVPWTKIVGEKSFVSVLQWTKLVILMCVSSFLCISLFVCLISYVFVANRFLSHTVCPDNNSPSFHPAQLPPTSLLPQIHSHSGSFSEKSKLPREDNQTGQNKTRQKPSYQVYTRQHGGRVPRAGRRSETHILPC